MGTGGPGVRSIISAVAQLGALEKRSPTHFPPLQGLASPGTLLGASLVPPVWVSKLVPFPGSKIGWNSGIAGRNAFLEGLGQGWGP